MLAFSRRPLLRRSTHHASQEWFPALQNAVGEMHDACALTEIAALCISGNGPTVVAESGETLLWNEDGVQLGGASLFIPRLVTFKNKFPEAWEGSTRIFSGPEYLLWLLTDSACTILPAPSFTAAYWDCDTLVDAGFTREEAGRLPPFVSPATVLAGLSRKAASFLGAEDVGFKTGLPVICGAPDFVSALVGTGTVEPGVLCDRAGSSEGLNFCSNVRVAGDRIRTLPSIIPGLWNASVLTVGDGRANESGARFDDFKLKYERETGSVIDYPALVATILSNDGNEATLDQGKYLMIEIALNLKSAGLLLKAEAQKLGLPFPDTMRVCGGQAKCAQWNQMKADITGMTVIAPEMPDAELTGDAAFAFMGLGFFPDIQAAAKAMYKAGDVFYPNREPPVTIQY